MAQCSLRVYTEKSEWAMNRPAFVDNNNTQYNYCTHSSLHFLFALLHTQIILEQLCKTMLTRFMRNQARCLRRHASTRDSSPGFAKAAEELIKTASTEVGGLLVQNGKDTVEDLRQLSSQVTALKESLDSKLNASNQSMSGVKEAIVAMDKNVCGLKAQIVLLTKTQQLHFAMIHRNVNSFDYQADNPNHHEDTSGDIVSFYLAPPRIHGCTFELVGTILLSFHRGSGYQLPTNAQVSGTFGSERFRRKLVTQIHELTGVEPRLTQLDGKWCIFYS